MSKRRDSATSSNQQSTCNFLMVDDPLRSPPQIGDKLVYLRQGHELYLRNAAEDNLEIGRDRELLEYPSSSDHELVLVEAVTHEMFPRRMRMQLRILDEENEEQATDRVFQLRYHDVDGVVEFLILKQIYDRSMATTWKVGDNFRAPIDDKWYTGRIAAIIEAFDDRYPDSEFNRYRVEWQDDDDDDEVYLSRWEIYPVGESDGATNESPIRKDEKKWLAYQPEPNDWPSANAFVRRISKHLGILMADSNVEPFVNLNLNDDAYSTKLEYPIDIGLIEERLRKGFYRRLSSLTFDIESLVKNVEKLGVADNVKLPSLTSPQNQQILPTTKAVSRTLMKIVGEPDRIFNTINLFERFQRREESLFEATMSKKKPRRRAKGAKKEAAKYVPPKAKAKKEKASRGKKKRRLLRSSSHSLIDIEQDSSSSSSVKNSLGDVNSKPATASSPSDTRNQVVVNVIIENDRKRRDSDGVAEVQKRRMIENSLVEAQENADFIDRCSDSSDVAIKVSKKRRIVSDDDDENVAGFSVNEDFAGPQAEKATAPERENSSPLIERKQLDSKNRDSTVLSSPSAMLEAVIDFEVDKEASCSNVVDSRRERRLSSEKSDSGDSADDDKMTLVEISSPPRQKHPPSEMDCEEEPMEIDDEETSHKDRSPAHNREKRLSQDVVPMSIDDEASSTLAMTSPIIDSRAYEVIGSQKSSDLPYMLEYPEPTQHREEKVVCSAWADSELPSQGGNDEAFGNINYVLSNPEANDDDGEELNYQVFQSDRESSSPLLDAEQIQEECYFADDDDSTIGCSSKRKLESGDDDHVRYLGSYDSSDGESCDDGYSTMMLDHCTLSQKSTKKFKVGAENFCTLADPLDSLTASTCWSSMMSYNHGSDLPSDADIGGLQLGECTLPESTESSDLIGLNSSVTMPSVAARSVSGEDDTFDKQYRPKTPTDSTSSQSDGSLRDEQAIELGDSVTMPPSVNLSTEGGRESSEENEKFVTVNDRDDYITDESSPSSSEYFTALEECGIM